MENLNNIPEQKHVARSLFGAALLAMFASSCCILPIVLMALGVGGAWIGSFSAFEPYRPVFILVTLILLGVAFFKVYRKPKDDCGCTDEPKRTTKAVLWVASILIVGLMTFPYALPLFSGETPGNSTPAGVKQVVLRIENMTCEGCFVTIKISLAKIDGVSGVELTLSPPEAKIYYDPEKTSIKNLIQATTNAGYPSFIKKELIQ